MIKVLMISRSTLHTSVGGDTVQILETASFLRRLGVDVEVKLTCEQIDYSKYDIIHFFNIIRPGDILKHIENCSIPFVVSTIFVDYGESEKLTRKGVIKVVNAVLSSDSIEYLKAIARFILNGEKIGSLKYFLWGHRKSVKYVIAKAARLLPNSSSEYHRLHKKYGVHQKYSVVPNSINKEHFDSAGSGEERTGVICVGRIEARKNQLNLIKALNELKLEGLIVGNPSPNSLKYYEECRREAEHGDITFVDHLPQEDLVQYYLKYKVHVLPSWFETTGLSSLEAAVMGCNIVVSPKGDTTEYFKDFATYCDPASVNSIKSAIQVAYQKENDGTLRNYVLEHYTWERTAELTLSAYKQVLSIK